MAVLRVREVSIDDLLSLERAQNAKAELELSKTVGVVNTHEQELGQAHRKTADLE